MKILASFHGFFIDLGVNYDIITKDAGEKDWLRCSDFLIPIDRNLNPRNIVELTDFSPTFFGKLHLAFNFDSKHKVDSNFVGSLLNSTSDGKVQRLHFYVSRGYSKYKLIEAVEKRSKDILHRPWCENLLPYIEKADSHPEIVHRTQSMIFVKDRFPKSCVHYLCIPRKRIDTWCFLKPEDIGLLMEMKKESKTFSESVSDFEVYKKFEFKFGFHVIPSMKQLHLHIISNDFDGPKLNAVQWNAFNTPFLVSIDEIISELQHKKIIEMPQERWLSYWKLLWEPLRCPICEKGFRSLDALKRHYHQELDK